MYVHMSHYWTKSSKCKSAEGHMVYKVCKSRSPRFLKNCYYLSSMILTLVQCPRVRSEGMCQQKSDPPPCPPQFHSTTNPLKSCQTRSYNHYHRHGPGCLHCSTATETHETQWQCWDTLNYSISCPVINSIPDTFPQHDIHNTINNAEHMTNNPVSPASSLF